MGLFTKTPEEIILEQERKKINNILYKINNSTTMDGPSKMLLIDYINKIRGGYPNDFKDLDSLYRVFDKLMSGAYVDYDDFLYHFDEVLRVFKLVINENDCNYERNVSRFVSSFIGPEGLIYNKLFDDSLCSIFKDKEDFFDVMSIILNNGDLSANFDVIKNYILAVNKYCLTQDILKRDVVSYLVEFTQLVDKDYEKFGREKLLRARKRIGDNDITPKELAKIETMLARTAELRQSLLLAMEDASDRITELDGIVDEKKNDIKLAGNAAAHEAKQTVHNEELSATRRMSKHELDLENKGSERFEEQIKQLFDSYKQQLEELKSLLSTYSESARNELAKIQTATQESIQALKDYATNEPRLQELITRAQEKNASREEIVALAKQEIEREQQEKANKAKGESSNTGPSLILPGYDRVMVPYHRIVLPEIVTTDPLPSLDDRISFNKRKEELEARIEANEKKGIIYHRKVKEIAIDIMEGDWPYLWGPSGTGKTYMIKQVAELLGMPSIKAGKITEKYSVLGYNDPQGRYVISPTFIASLYGYLLILDEFDNGNPDTQVVLNDIYSELLDKLNDPSEVCEVLFGEDIPVDINPNFRMASAGNTNGEGENEMYSSRGKVDESIHERWTPVYIDYDYRVEKSILSEYPQWYDFFIKFREACTRYATSNNSSEVIGSTSTRDAAKLERYISHNSKTVDQIISEMFIQTKDPDYLQKLSGYLCDMYGMKSDECYDVPFSKPISKADGKVLARKFVAFSRQGIR